MEKNVFEENVYIFFLWVIEIISNIVYVAWKIFLLSFVLYNWTISIVGINLARFYLELKMGGKGENYL